MPTLDTPGQPFGFEAIYARPSMRSPNKGRVYFVTLEVTKDVFDAFCAADQANSYAVLVSKLDYDAVQEPETVQEVKPEGEYAYIAREFFAHNWFLSPSISKALTHLGVIPNDARLAKVHLKAKMQPFQAEGFSLKDVSPYDWQMWAREAGCLNEIQQMLKQAEARK